MKIWIYKNHFTFKTFDYNIIIFLFTTMIVLITIIATTIIFLNIVIGTICINFPSHTINYISTQHQAMIIGYLNNNIQALSIISILICNNYMISFINSITNKIINKEIMYKIQTFQWQHQLNQWIVFMASSIILQHSNLWNLELWNI